MEYDIKYDAFRADAFAIGMVMLELITLDKPKFYYTEERTELKIDRISFDIASVSKKFSEAFIGLLKGCLQPIPANRLTLAQAN